MTRAFRHSASGSNTVMAILSQRILLFLVEEVTTRPLRQRAVRLATTYYKTPQRRDAQRDKEQFADKAGIRC
jgi:hypothetical protein